MIDLREINNMSYRLKCVRIPNYIIEDIVFTQYLYKLCTSYVHTQIGIKSTQQPITIWTLYYFFQFIIPYLIWLCTNVYVAPSHGSCIQNYTKLYITGVARVMFALTCDAPPLTDFEIQLFLFPLFHSLYSASNL